MTCVCVDLFHSFRCHARVPLLLYNGIYASKCNVAMQICTLKIPKREAQNADISVPLRAPQAIADLMAACHQDNPRDRPRIGHICDTLESLDN